jgi:hypothetical protein
MSSKYQEAITIPEGLPELVKAFAREVLRAQASGRKLFGTCVAVNLFTQALLPPSVDRAPTTCAPARALAAEDPRAARFAARGRLRFWGAVLCRPGGVEEGGRRRRRMRAWARGRVPTWLEQPRPDAARAGVMRTRRIRLCSHGGQEKGGRRVLVPSQGLLADRRTRGAKLATTARLSQSVGGAHTLYTQMQLHGRGNDRAGLLLGRATG